jgi:phospholipase C
MSNLLGAFDFDHVSCSPFFCHISHAKLTPLQPDYSIPTLVEALTPHEDSSGNWEAASICQGTYGNPPPKPPAPFGPTNEALDPSTLSEQGFKSVRGYLTEGRYLIFEMNGYALTVSSTNATDITGTKATSIHNRKNQRFVIHATSGTATLGGEGAGAFLISSALDKQYIADHKSFSKAVSGAETYTIEDLGSGQGYSLMKENGKFLSIDGNGVIDIISQAAGFRVFSVTYQS